MASAQSPEVVCHGVLASRGLRLTLALPRALQVEAPPMFPPTFLYTQSWEDPRPDAKVLSPEAAGL